MITRIAKEFKWEMSHRLTFHKGPCKNIHGHSYKMLMELEGESNSEGMLLDYFDMELLVRPLLNQLDHAFICDSRDEMMIAFLSQNGLKHYIIDDFTTAENLAVYFLDYFAPLLKPFPNITGLKIKIFETEDVFAEVAKNLDI